MSEKPILSLSLTLFKRPLRGSQRAQIWALIGIIFTAVVSAVIKFGFFSNV